MLVVLVLLTLCCIAWFKLLSFSHVQPQLKYPPGPVAIPLLGNIFHLNHVSPWKTYQQWGKNFGNLLSFNILGRHIVVINSLSIATELLDQRSTIYSGKPRLEMLNLMGWGFNLAFMQYNDPRRKQLRRMIHKGVGQPSIMNIQTLALEQSEALILQLSESPKKFMEHIVHYTALIVLQHTLGPIDWTKYKYIMYDITLKAIHTMSESVFFGAQAVFAFPLLGQLPLYCFGPSFKKIASEQQYLTARLKEEPLQIAKSQINCQYSSWAAELLEEHSSGSSSAPSEDNIKDAMGTILSALQISISRSPYSILALVLNPHVQKHAQEDIDMVVGNHRLPSFEDRESLPFITAICQETLRWHTPTPLAAHSTNQEDEYSGYNIPADTAIMANIWAMTRDADIFPSPDQFDPERFMDQGHLITDNMNFLWGFGRRLFAESTLWIAIARILAVYNIERAKTPLGEEIEVEENYTNTGLFITPKPFQCDFVARSDKSKALLDHLRLASDDSRQLLELEL
ncbi:cytochrome P450 [Lentinula raphanica]|nr:cytochrome P450 [Lentinula raphanica]